MVSEVWSQQLRVRDFFSTENITKFKPTITVLKATLSQPHTSLSSPRLQSTAIPPFPLRVTTTRENMLDFSRKTAYFLRKLALESTF